MGEAIMAIVGALDRRGLHGIINLGLRNLDCLRLVVLFILTLDSQVLISSI